MLWELKDRYRADGIGAVAKDLDGVEAPKSQEERDYPVLAIAEQKVLAPNMQVLVMQCYKRYVHVRETTCTPRV